MDRSHEIKLSTDSISIKVNSGSIVFPGYEALKRDALELAEHIADIEVTDENIKESKKLLAAVNNSIKELEQRRISVKKAILEPYNAFEDQVKEIVAIVKEADTTVRNQVKQLEETERTNKEKAIEEIFLKRKKHYAALDGLIDFFSFLNPKHLNKTTTIEAVEKEMIEFFERVNADINVISEMDERETILRYYVDVLDLTTSLTLVNEEKRRTEAVKASEVIKQRRNPSAFIVYNDKDALLVRMFLEQNSIKFDEKEV